MKKTFVSARSRRAVRTSIVALATTALLLPAAPAYAAIASPPEAPHDITVFSVRDMVEVAGYPVGSTVEIKVLRNGVTIGRTTGTANADGGYEVNHDNAKCWIGHTPDISPGDVVQATTPDGNGDSVVVSDVQTDAVFADGEDLVAKGTAKSPSGGQLSLDLLEARVIAPDLTETAIGRRDLRAPNERGGYTSSVAYDAPGSTNFTARYSNLPDGVQEIALEGETRIMGWQGMGTVIEEGVEEEGPVGLTIYENGAPEGGAPGCPGRADYAVTASNPTSVNLATNGVGDGLVLSGISNDASAITVKVDDNDAATPAADADATVSDPAGPQSWTATIPWAEIDALNEGTLTASASYTVGTGSVSGRTLSVLKDLDAPDAPAATPPAGNYSGSQSVSLRNATEPSLPLYYTNDGSAPVIDPADRYSGPINVTATQTIRAFSVDAAGNKGAEFSGRYVIGTDTTPTEDTTAPRIVGRVPSINSTGAAVGTNVTVRFSEALAASTVTETTFFLRTVAGTVVPATVSWVGGPNNEAVLNPTSNLAAGTVYNATVTNGLEDAAGNALSAPPQLTWSFTTAGTAPAPDDTTAPRIVGRVPSIGATGAAVGTNVTVRFSEALAASTVTGTNFFLRANGSTTNIPASVSWVGGANNEAVLNPTSNLAAGTVYNATVTNGLQDAAGNALAAPPQLTWSFTTAGTATPSDTTAPKLTGRLPGIGATNVPRSTNVFAMFSENVNTSTVNSTNFSVRRVDNNAAVSGAFTHTAATATSSARSTFNPTGLLAANTQYRVTLTSSITDAAGNGLTTPPVIVWTFTTGAS